MSANPPLSATHPTPTALEIATLAAAFLPKIDLPEDWQKSDPDSLRYDVGKPSEEFDHPEYGDYRNVWDALCEEAVRRSKALLFAAAGDVRPGVIEHGKQFEEDWNANRAFEEEERKARMLFDKRAGERTVIPFGEALEEVLQRHKPSARLQYWELFAEENSRMRKLIFGLPMTRRALNQNDSGKTDIERYLSRDQFVQFVTVFQRAKVTHGEAWRKQIDRANGGKGGRKTQAKKLAAEAGEVTVDHTSEREDRRLTKADAEHVARKPRIKKH